MPRKPVTTVEAFRRSVALKYQLYNSLFLTLPFPKMRDIGNVLPIFGATCKQMLEEGKSPKAIIAHLFKEIVPTRSFEEKTNILFLFLQFVERQVVLFDALEDAAFDTTHEMDGPGSLEVFLSSLNNHERRNQFCQALETYRTRLVLTAHPTQFYPEPVLDIIQDLSEALKQNDLATIETLLLQMGKTSFRRKRKPTPLSEAGDLLRRSEKTFYDVMVDIEERIAQRVCPGSTSLELGFWPGGDRDGNPNVTAETTADVADRLRKSILKRYSQEIKTLRRRLTFPGTSERLERIGEVLELTKQYDPDGYLEPGELLEDLANLRSDVEENHQGLFIKKIDRLILAVKLFGFHFASMDLRQDAGVHTQAVHELFREVGRERKLPSACAEYKALPSKEKRELLTTLLKRKAPSLHRIKMELSPLSWDVLESLSAAQLIQQHNGEKGLNRYVISNASEAHHVLEVLLLAVWLGTPLKELKLDIVPLFETIDDLTAAPTTMESLYQIPIYKRHLKRRNTVQTVMCGYSDGTKDGGYVTCSWAIFKAKRLLSAISSRNGVDVVFFDGRGGPPARGGGNTRRFYSSLGYQIPQREIQLTIQGQTISSKFGSFDSSRYNVEQLFTAGFDPMLFPNPGETLKPEQLRLLEQLSDISYEAYHCLRSDPNFIPYMEQITPLNFFGELNIASRPPKRGKSQKLTLEDLRAIPFVGAWSQVKQNIPGFYGLGTALQALYRDHQGPLLQALYEKSLFFRTLIDNAMQSLAKSYLPITQWVSRDRQFGPLWRTIRKEVELTKKMIYKLTGEKCLLSDEPEIMRSIELREELIVPLLVIQQYAMIMRKETKSRAHKKIYEKLILKSLPPNINASRNSA